MYKFKWLAFGIVLVTIALGIIFISLDVLDIEESARLHLPIAIINTALISAMAFLVTYMAARNFTRVSSPEMLGLGCAVLAFGLGSLIRGWLPSAGLNVPITVNDSSALIASIMHLFGAILSIPKPYGLKSEPGLKQRTILFSYVGILVSITLVTTLAFIDVIPTFVTLGESSTVLRDVIRGIAAVFSIASALIYLRMYYQSRMNIHYWYSMGLMLFSLGIIFISLGAVESRIAWLGRASQYLSGIYFLVAVLSVYRQGRTCV